MIISPQNLSGLEYRGAKKTYMSSSPIYDIYSGIHHIHNANSKKHRVLINPFHTPEYYFSSSSCEEEKFIIEVLEAFENISESFEIIFRPHPGINIEHLKYLIETRYRHLNIKYSESGTFYDAISKADLFISMPSTAIFEAAAAGVPSIFYDQGDYDWISPFDPSNKDLPQARSVTALKALLEKFLVEFDADDWFISDNVLEKYAIKKDGRISEAIWKDIKKIIEAVD